MPVEYSMHTLNKLILIENSEEIEHDSRRSFGPNSLSVLLISMERFSFAAGVVHLKRSLSAIIRMFLSFIFTNYYNLNSITTAYNS